VEDDVTSTDSTLDQSTAPTTRSAGLVAVEVTKSFGPTVALRDVTVEFAAGTVHGLVGENGSGKSTFVKIVAGIHRADQGLISFGGTELNPRRYRIPGATKVACVYQDGSLIDELTVGQNLELMLDPRERAEYEHEGVEWQRVLLDAYGLQSINVDAAIGRIPNNEQRLVEIAGVLARRPDVLLFDESTSTLDEGAVATVLGWMREAADRGACVVFVTHRLREVLLVASRVVVLRDGALVREFDTAAVDEDAVVEAMAGRRVAALDRRVAPTLGPVVLTAEQVVTARSGPNTIEVRRGEILGIGGAAGNGQAELARALAGRGIRSGTVTVDGTRLRRVEDGPGAGVVFVSSDRRRESLYSQLSIRENFTLGLVAAKASSWRWLRRGPEVDRAREVTEQFGVVVSSIEAPVTAMSGGNQQKVAIGKAIVREPDVLIVEEPSEGVDVRSRLDIYRALLAVAEQGKAVVVTSSDASELRLLADRVIVLARGREVAELNGEAVTEQAIVHAFSTAQARERDDAAQTEPGLKPLPFLRRRSDRAPRPWNAANFALLVVLLVALALVAANHDSKFLSQRNIGGICLLALPAVLAALAQLPIMLSGQIDASLGSMMGLVVVMLSFYPDTPWPVLILASIALGLVLGAVNALLVVRLRINSVIATVATLGIFQGAALIIRKEPGGLISIGLTNAINNAWASIPIFFIVVAVLAVVADIGINVTRPGLKLRSIGFSADRSTQLGVHSRTYHAMTYIVGGGIAGIGGAVLAGLTGTGDGTVGSGYTLLSLAIPVIGGAALAGGLGSAVGCLLGGLFVAEVQQFVPFMNFPGGDYLIAVGALTLVALAIGSRASFASD
jgi:ABC-type sugar transport system ATPase subunit/ribose/xylose/arabinose/galactoside ABC-type transport system permease subunit